MGKVILIFVICVTMIGAVYYFSGQQRAQFDMNKLEANDEFMVLARNAALMGLDRAEQSLADEFSSFGKRTGAHEGAQYEYQATRTGNNRVVVRSTATAQGRDGTKMTFNIRAQYERRAWNRIADSPPLFMDYALNTGGGIHINGSVKGHAYDPPDNSSAPANTNFHTNGFLEIKGNSPDVEGFGTYVLGALKDKNWVAKTFVPNDNPTGSATAYQVAPMTMPTVVPAAMATALVPDSVTAGNVVVSGPGDLPPMNGTREDPFVWHIQGNLTFAGDVSISGYAMFLVDNTVSFNSKVSSPQTSFDGSDESTLAFYAGNIASLGGGSAVWGQIFSPRASFSGNGSVELYGNVVTNGRVDFGGSVDVYYRRASPALTTYWQGGSNDRLVRVSYSEWSKTDY